VRRFFGMSGWAGGFGEHADRCDDQTGTKKGGAHWLLDPRYWGWVAGTCGRFGERPPGNVSGAMYAEYVIPESVPDVPAMPDAPPDMPGIPADPTPPGGDPEPMDIAA